MFKTQTGDCRLARRRSGRCVALLLAVLIGTTLAGCWPTTVKPDTAELPGGPKRFTPSYDQTIGAYADLPGDQHTLVRGYGLVIMPKATGSRECPSGIRKVVVSQLNRLGVGETTSLLSGLRIDQWIDSLNTAVVEVRGLLPAWGLGDDTFDVMVTPLSDSQTTSLEGGVLVLTELSIWERSRTGGWIHGKTMALASGPVFINPFSEPDAVAAPGRPGGPGSPEPDTVGRPVGTPVDFCRGWVLGGGTILKDQPLRLTFREPDYYRADLASQQINTRFPCPQYARGAAHATKPSSIDLKVPPEYRRQVNFWLALVQQIYLNRTPGFLERRAVELANELTWPDATDSQRLRVAMSFVAMGKPAVPVIKPLYAHEAPSVAFHAAYAGLRMGDPLAAQTLCELAKDRQHRYRRPAIQALGQPHPFSALASELAPLLDEEDPEIRIDAYQSMARLGANCIARYSVGLRRLSFQLDVVSCKGPYLIYVTRSDQPRIVVFGGDSMRLANPVFLHSERTGVTVFARPGDRQLNAMRIDPATNRLAVVRYEDVPVMDPKTGQPVLDPETGQPQVQRRPHTELKTSFLAADLIRRLGGQPHMNMDNELVGLGLNYSQVVHVLHQLSQSGTLPSAIRLQQLRGPNVELAREWSSSVSADEPVAEEPASSPDEPDDQTEPDKPPPITIDRPTGPPRMD